MSQEIDRLSENQNSQDQAAVRPRASRELVVVATPQAALRTTTDDVASTVGANVDLLKTILVRAGATMHPLFGDSEERIRASVAALSAQGAPNMPDLSRYYRVNAGDEQLEALAEKLRELDVVHTAYVKPGAEPATLMNSVVAMTAQPPMTTPDFSTRQGYLDAAPGGVDARYAWTKPGGAGAGVGLIDIEGEWRFTHEDLLQNQGGIVGGTLPNDLGWRNHGTAVVGIFGADNNNFGVTGICYDANVRAISMMGVNWGSAQSIRRAADLLNPGDIILIEFHRPGPRYNFQPRTDERGYIPVEWWPDDFDAITYALGRGVVIVETAGNGYENLDDVIYDTPALGFPSNWSNPFRRGSRDCGAILVGAGAPPPGTHGKNYGNDRCRMAFSNYGSSLDAQGWGAEVTATGYGDLQGGLNEDLWYTDVFNGTSSASPMVAGALGCVQGYLRANAMPPLTPGAARALFRTTGSPQQDGPQGLASQRIGNRPDLKQMLDSLVTQPLARVALYRYANTTNADHFYTTNWGEMGTGGPGWNFEGVQCYVYPTQVQGSVPLYRYWNPSIADHFYTTNWAELGSGKFGWTYEMVQCYVFPVQTLGSIPLYRYWSAGGGTHFYTTNWNELGNGLYGWAFELIQCYVFAGMTNDSTMTAPALSAAMKFSAANPASASSTSAQGEQDQAQAASLTAPRGNTG